MKLRFLIFMLLVSCCGLSSCIYDDEPECCRQEKVSVEVCIAPENPDHITRSTDEDAIFDVNLLLYGPGGSYTFYSAAPHLHFECLPGDYTLYVVANAHMDMRNFTAEMLETFAALYRPAYDDLLMTTVRQVEIPSGAGKVILPPIAVERAVARIDYDITVDESVSDIEIRSVQAMNLPIHYHPFAEGFRPVDFVDGESVPVSDSPTIQGSFYMLPNRQGVQSSITSPEEKNPDNAPDDATCLHIRAVRGGKVLDYYVYLGENDTSDFNVRPNTVHTLHIRILGDNDLRLRQYAVDIGMMTGSVAYDGFMLDCLDGELNVRLSGYYEHMQVRGILSLDKGDVAYCQFCGVRYVAPQEYDFAAGTWSGAMAYFPDTFTRENMQLQFTLTVYDKYGEVGRYTFEYAFAYVLQVYRVWHNGPWEVLGHIESEDALKIVEHKTISALYDAVYYTYKSDGIEFTAIPETGYMTDCWCISPNHSGEVSYDASYHHEPLYGPKAVYLYFKSLGSSLNVSFRQSRPELSAYDRAVLDFTVEQAGYNGTYTVKIDGSPTFFASDIWTSVL